MEESVEYKHPEITDEGNGWYRVSISLRPKVNGIPADIPKQDLTRSLLRNMPSIIYWILEGIRKENPGEITKRSED